jgi:hypothetical protein
MKAQSTLYCFTKALRTLSAFDSVSLQNLCVKLASNFELAFEKKQNLPLTIL